jgi:hypothetical protein
MRGEKNNIRKTIQYSILVSLGSGAKTYNMTTHRYDLTLPDTRVFKADGNLLSVDTVRMSAIIDRSQFKIVLADPKFAFGELLDNNDPKEKSLTGAPMSIYICFIDTDTRIPLLSDLLTVYEGTIDVYGYTVDTNINGNAALSITGASPMGNLDQKKFMELSKQASRARNENDSSCDQLFDGSSALTLRWGKRT